MSTQQAAGVNRPPARGILSCSFCRQKKLRCDRLQPCGSCMKRGVLCTYNYSPPPRRNTHAPPRRSANKQLNERLEQLENLVMTLGGRGAQQNTNDEAHLNGSEKVHPSCIPSRKANGASAESENTRNKLTEGQDLEHEDAHGWVASAFGRMQVGDGRITYVSGMHWTALQHSIAEIRQFIKEDDGSEEDSPTPQPPGGSTLLLGLTVPPPREDILAALPPKSTVDELVSEFLNSKEPGVLLIHIPTFQKEYDIFWNNPMEMPPAWVSMLFSIMCLAVRLCSRSADGFFRESCERDNEVNNWRLQAALCLVDSRYTTPSKYTIEALLLYTSTEYVRGHDTKHEVWLLMGMIIRIGMRAGLHRDASHYPEISCFDGEMRRRQWAMMKQLDALFSFQNGMPRITRDGLSDTKMPGNYRDEDFDENSTTLPPERPDTDPAPVYFLISKATLASAFGAIIDAVTSTQPLSYQTVLHLDKRLHEDYARVPPLLRFRSADKSTTDLPDTIVQRYILQIMFQKSRCILHRKYLCKGRSDPKYLYSRRACLDAAMQLLQHQVTIDDQVQPGGVLYQNRWFAMSLTSHDFILATMIICVELHFLARRKDDGEEPIYSQYELMEVLKSSHGIWEEYKTRSAEATQAWRSISAMLASANVQTNGKDICPTGQDASDGNQQLGTDTPGAAADRAEGQNGHNSRSTTSDIGNEILQYDPYPHLLNAEQELLPLEMPAQQLNQPDFELPLPPQPLNPTDVDVWMENFLDLPDNFDWNSWDTSVQNPNSGAGMSWTPFHK